MSERNRTGGGLSRRRVLKMAGAGCVLVAAVPFAASATPESAQAVVDKIAAGRARKDGKVNITLPEIAENGSTVPLTAHVDSPMSDADHVTAIHIIASGNPLPELANYFLGPHNGKAEISMRIRLGQTQKVIVMAELSNGDVHVARREIKVTIGGCGG